jgi:polysaccharide biosynthesis/export protein
MDVKHFLVIFTVIIFTGSSCSHRGFRKFKSVPESDFEVEEMTLEDNYKVMEEGSPEYKIGIGDEIKISIYGNPQDSTQATALGEIFGHSVDENGEINIPLLKQIRIEGLTRRDASSLLDQKYSEFIKNPHVMLDVVKYESQFYYVIGNVSNAGKHPVKVNTNLLEAVTKMVPAQETASIQFIYMKRGETVIPVRISEIATGSRNFDKFFLKDGDTFYVPHPSANRAYILGEVKNPGAFELSGGSYTLLDLVADAGGLVPPYASEGRIYMVRQTPEKHLLVRLSFDDIFSGKAGGIVLLPGDRVLVSPTALTSYNRIIQQLLPTFQMLYTGTLLYRNWTR